MQFFSQQVVIEGIDAYGEVDRLCKMRGFIKVSDAGDIWISPFPVLRIEKKNSQRTIYKIPDRDIFITLGSPGGTCMRIDGRDTEDIVYALHKLGFEKRCILQYIQQIK